MEFTLQGLLNNIQIIGFEILLLPYVVYSLTLKFSAHVTETSLNFYWTMYHISEVNTFLNTLGTGVANLQFKLFSDGGLEMQCNAVTTGKSFALSLPSLILDIYS
jgi:hypothetical protein